jgi:hypothetical protein
MSTYLARILTVTAVASFVALAACSSSSDSAASSCSSAKQVSDDCNAKQGSGDGGTKVTTNFDAAKCEQAGDNGKKVADCIVANKDNCDCILKCSLGGTC